MKASEQLILAAAKLAGSAAGSWDEFLAALIIWQNEQLITMAQASTDKVFVCQGRAQLAREFLEQMKNCRNTANAIQEKMKNG